MRTTLRNFEYLMAYGTEIDFYFEDTEQVWKTTVPNYGPNMNREVLSIYPLGRNKIRITLGKEIRNG